MRETIFNISINYFNRNFRFSQTKKIFSDDLIPEFNSLSIRDENS